MPRLWTDTIETHRRTVRDAALEAAAGLVAELGIRSVTMSEIATRTGIGRATLYKYFPDADSILRAWHEREIGRHFDRLVEARDQSDSAPERLRSVLHGYALIAHQSRGHQEGALTAHLHQDEHVRRAERRLIVLIGVVLADAQASGDVRDDVAADELAHYCVHALGAAPALRSKAAVDRLVEVTIAGLQPR
jgi:AcrR family transcriptional regulator